MPPPLSESEFMIMANGCIRSTGATEKKHMGMVMKELQSMIKGRFDGKRASLIVGNMLDPNVTITNP